MTDRQDAAWDRARDERKHYTPDPPQNDSPELRQLLAAWSLIKMLEKIAGAGRLSETDEATCRRLIVKACVEFGIPTQAERA